MPTEHSSDVKFEIGHVLFIDIVGYSKLLINEQSEQIQKLKGIVRRTEQVRLAETEGKLVRLPTGDGGALVFRNSPEAPVLCALEITQELQKHPGSKEKPQLKLRMGIHSGPVNEVVDLNEQSNIAGAGINIAQRVMDCGDAGDILLSKRVAEDLTQYRQWELLLHDLGEVEVKHGVRVHVFNLYNEELGNPEVPGKLRNAKPKEQEASDASARREEGFWIAVLPFKYVGANADPCSCCCTTSGRICADQPLRPLRICYRFVLPEGLPGFPRGSEARPRLESHGFLHRGNTRKHDRLCR